MDAPGLSSTAPVRVPSDRRRLARRGAGDPSFMTGEPRLGDPPVRFPKNPSVLGRRRANHPPGAPTLRNVNTRTDLLMHTKRVVFLAVALTTTGVRAQDEYKVSALKEAPPAALAGPVREALEGQGYRVVDGQGKAVIDVWLRKAIPASGKPAGSKGAVLFPVLAEGELLGAIRFPTAGHDYRDQSINPGVYTMRYGLQPINGDHLGVSPYRDFALLVSAAKDSTVADLPSKKLENQSAEAAGSSHPAVLMLVAAPADAKAEPTLVHDGEKNTWGLVVAPSLSVSGESGPVKLPLQLIVVGAAMN
jgi:hypothetical protein